MNAKELRELLLSSSLVKLPGGVGKRLVDWLYPRRPETPLADLLVEMAAVDPDFIDWLEFWFCEHLLPDDDQDFKVSLIDAQWARDEQRVEADRQYARNVAQIFEETAEKVKWMVEELK